MMMVMMMVVMIFIQNVGHDGDGNHAENLRVFMIIPNNYDAC